MGSISARVFIELPDIAKSVQGEMQAIEAGDGSPASRSDIVVAIDNPPPAESPAIAIFEPVKPLLSSHRYAEVASSNAPGNGCSGARR